LRRMPPKTRFFLDVTPPATSCDGGFCRSDPIKRAPGTRHFRTTAKGRAVATFVMPATYQYSSTHTPETRQETAFTNQQQLEVIAVAVGTKEGWPAIYTAHAGAVAEIPPSP